MLTLYLTLYRGLDISVQNILGSEHYLNLLMRYCVGPTSAPPSKITASHHLYLEASHVLGMEKAQIR